MNSKRSHAVRWVFATLTALAVQGACAASPAEFYRGKTIDLIVSTGTGTSYDLMGRLLARFLQKKIPGSPDIVVQNMPGADGLVAANYLYNAGPKDGTVIAGLQGTIPFQPLLGTTQAKFDAKKFNWLGSISDETCVLVMRLGAPVHTLADLKSTEATVGTSSSASNPAFYARLVNTLFRTKLKLVLGYPSQNDVFVAMERHEVDGHACVFYSALVSTRPDWVTNKAVQLLLQIGPEKLSAISDVPFASDLVQNSQDKLLLQASLAPLALGRPYAMAPGTPADRVDAVRAALKEVLADPGFRSEIKRMHLQIENPRSAQQVRTLIDATYALPSESIARMKKLMQP